MDLVKRQFLNRKHLVGAFILLGVAAGLVLAVSGRLSTPRVILRWPLGLTDTNGYRAKANQAPGDELVLVYIGSSGCSWSNGPELPGIVSGLKTTLQDQAQNSGRAFAAVGIARDGIAATGISHLAKFGEFDEVMSGRGWANTGIQKYVYGDLPGEGATPQVLVVTRTLDYRLGHVSVVDERVLVRKVGIDEITDWVDAGAHVPL